MPLRKRKPTSPGRRFQTVSDFSEITKTRPEKSLLPVARMPVVCHESVIVAWPMGTMEATSSGTPSTYERSPFRCIHAATNSQRA